MDIVKNRYLISVNAEIDGMELSDSTESPETLIDRIASSCLSGLLMNNTLCEVEQSYKDID